MKRGFSLIELLIVVAILSVLSGGAILTYGETFRAAQDNTRRNNMATLRRAIDEYHADHGRYPNDLEDLVEARYLREIPIDPVTESNQTWILVASAEGVPDVYDIKAPPWPTLHRGEGRK